MKKLAITVSFLVAVVTGIAAFTWILGFAPNPQFMWYLVATAAGCFVAACVVAAGGGIVDRFFGFNEGNILGQAAEVLAGAGAVAGGWPFVALIAATFG